MNDKVHGGFNFLKLVLKSKLFLLFISFFVLLLLFLFVDVKI